MGGEKCVEINENKVREKVELAQKYFNKAGPINVYSLLGFSLEMGVSTASFASFFFLYHADFMALSLSSDLHSICALLIMKVLMAFLNSFEASCRVNFIDTKTAERIWNDKFLV